MAKKNKNKTPLEILRDKKDKLDWQLFNFLENLLVFCVKKERSVPKESGVHFRITPEKDCECLCLLFEIDRQKDPLFEAGMSRPDYMVLYADKNGCLFTIIEMKGTTEKGFKHGIEQIRVLRDRLKGELRDNCTNKLKVYFQAILLTPFNAQIPRNLITKEKQNGLVILPLQFDHKAELFKFVSKKNEITERYTHKEIKTSTCYFEVLENLLTNFALQEHIKNCDFYSEKKKDKREKQGIYINYALPDDENGYSVLAVDSRNAVIAVKETENQYKEKIAEELNKLGVDLKRHIELKDLSNKV